MRGWALEGVTQREHDVAMVPGGICLCPLRGNDRVDRTIQAAARDRDVCRRT